MDNPAVKHSLCYSCSGRDVHESVKSWLHLTDDFWFAEINFSSNRKLKTGEYETLWRLPNFRLPNLDLVSQVETTLAGSNEHISPVKTHTYIHEKLNKTITLNFVGGCAVNAFNCLPVDELAVFVNRGDQCVDGEGSSGICGLSD